MRPTSSHAVRPAEARLDALQRADKWYLADGCGAIWAPPFPVWLREPGFWDQGHLYEVAFGPLFTVALITQDGVAVPLVQTRRNWRPDRLVCSYQAHDGTQLTETRQLLPNGRYCSQWSWQALPQAAFLVAFSAQISQTSSGYKRSPDGHRVRWLSRATSRVGGEMAIDLTLHAQSPPGSLTSSAIQRCQSTICHPVWQLSPFVESWEPGQGLLAMDIEPGIDDHGQDWIGLSVGIEGEDGSGVTFQMQAVSNPKDTAPTPTNDQHWHTHFDSYPAFSCSDPFLQRYFDYRLYGLHLCEVRGSNGHIRHPAVTEGIEYFHVPITYSGQCHMLETRWSQTPHVARGTLLNFLDNQKPDGSLHGRIYQTSLAKTDFYHANWGDALLAVDALHPDQSYLTRVYGGLDRYLNWLISARDPEDTGTIEVVNHFETGQEYMSRYQVVNASADADGWVSRTRLKGVDATVYAYQLALALQKIATWRGDSDAASRHQQRADRIGSAIRERMWEPQTGLFSDLEPNGLTRTGVKAAVCFYPMLTDLPTGEQVAALLRHLTNPDEFATPWPLPSSSLDDPKFDPSARWQGKRHLCPWNGRVWPMTTSHVIEGLIRQWKRGDELPPDIRQQCGQLAGQWITQFIHMMFHHRDVNRPNCFEHYNPFTGQPCEYRGIDDYQHSWVVDLIMSGIMGIGVDVDAAGQAILKIDPLPVNLEHARIDNAWVRGQQLTITRTGNQYEVEVAGQRMRSTIGAPVTLKLDASHVHPVILDAGKVPTRPEKRKAVVGQTPAAE